jgi:hypothetical protein
MKKTALFVTALAAATMALSSCAKDRTCTCTDSDGDTWKETLVGVTKGQAKANCISTSYTDNGDTYTINCKLD